MTDLEVVPNPKPAKRENKPIPENMKATIGWVLYKFATENNVGHLKQLAEHLAIELGKTLPTEQSEMDDLVTSYLEENSGKPG